MMTTSRRFQMTSQRKRGQQQEKQWEKGELSSSGAGGSTRRTLSTASKNNRGRAGLGVALSAHKSAATAIDRVL